MRSLSVDYPTCRHNTTMAFDHLVTEDLDEIYAFAVQLGKDAGKLLMTAAQLRFNGQGREQEALNLVEKENAVDIVTQADEGALYT